VSALADQAEAVARAGYAMAERFARGGTLFAFGSGPAATDAQHVAVEFVHPVIVGKRALPALSVAAAEELATLCRPDDVALGIAPDGRDDGLVRGLDGARQRGSLTVALTGGVETGLTVDHHLHVASDDPLVVKEAHVTAYHLLWELVHVFFEQPGLLAVGR